MWEMKMQTPQDAAYLLDLAMCVGGRAGPNAVASECFEYAARVAAAIDEAGRDAFVVRGSSPDELGSLRAWSSLLATVEPPPDGEACKHFWVACDDWIIDPTADQFNPELEPGSERPRWAEHVDPVIVVSAGDARYVERRRISIREIGCT